MIAGTLEIQMMADMARLANDMHKAQRTVYGAMANIEKSVIAAKSVLASLGIGLSAIGFVHLIKSSIDAADHLNDLSKSTNLTVTELAGLNLLAKQSGTDLDALAKAINKMSVEMGKEPEKFRALGITAKSSKEALMQFADVFNLLPDINQRNALAQAVFSKSWEQLAPVLAEGGQKIGETIDRGARMSRVTQQLGIDADRFNDSMAELGTTSSGFAMLLASNMLPGLNSTTAAMNELASAGHPVIALWRGLMGMGQVPWDFLIPPTQLKQELSSAGRLIELKGNLAMMNARLGNEALYNNQAELKKSIEIAQNMIAVLEKHGAAIDKGIMPASAVQQAAQAAAAKKAQDFLDAEKLAAGKKAAWKKAATELTRDNELFDKQIIEQEKDRYAEEVRLAEKAADDITAANKAAALESAREWERFTENVQRNLGDVLYLGLQGKFNDIGDLFHHLLLRMTADAAAAQLTQAMFGAGTSLLGGAAGAAGGYSMAQGTAYYAAGGSVSGAFSGGTAMGIGAAARAVAPYAAAAVGAYMVAKYGFGWGNERELVGGNRLVGQFNRSGFTGGFEQSWKQDGGMFGSEGSGVYKTALTTAQGQAFQATVNGLQSTFDALGASLGDLSIRTRAWSVDVNQAGDVTGTLADGIGKQLLPQLEKFRLAGETLADTAARLTGVFATTNSFIVALGVSSLDAFGAIGINSAAARQQLTDLAGGPNAFGQKAGSFIQNFLTGAQQLQPALDAVGRTFSDLGIVGVETNEQFADLVKLNLQLGQYATVNKLLDVADAFNAVTKAASALLSTDTFATMTDYLRAVGRQSNAAGGMISGATAAVRPVVEQEQIANDLAIQESARRVAAKEAARLYVESWMPRLMYEFGSFASGIYGGEKREAFLSSIGAAYPSKLHWLTEFYAVKDQYESLPSYASGNPYVGYDMTANIHRGEMVVDAQSASMMRRYGLGSGNDALIIEIRALRAEVARLRGSAESTAHNTEVTARSTRNTSDLLRLVTRDGESLLTTPA